MLNQVVRHQAMSFQDKGEFQNELCIAGAMQSVVECLRAATCTSPDTPRLARLRTQLSLFASSMLEATWEHCPEADGNAGTGQGWKVPDKTNEAAWYRPQGCALACLTCAPKLAGTQSSDGGAPPFAHPVC